MFLISDWCEKVLQAEFFQKLDAPSILRFLPRARQAGSVIHRVFRSVHERVMGNY
jgi:hypothetical protein